MSISLWSRICVTCYRVTNKPNPKLSSKSPSPKIFAINDVDLLKSYLDKALSRRKQIGTILSRMKRSQSCYKYQRFMAKKYKILVSALQARVNKLEGKTEYPHLLTDYNIHFKPNNELLQKVIVSPKIVRPASAYIRSKEQYLKHRREPTFIPK